MSRNLFRIGSLRVILIVLAALAVVPTLGFAQTNGKFTDQKGGSEKAVRQTLDDLYNALRTNDADALDRIYAAEYTFVNETGAMETKAPRLAALRSGELKFESLSFNNPVIRIHGNTAVATYDVAVKGRSKGKEIGGPVRVTTTFVKMDGRWQLIAAQATRVE